MAEADLITRSPRFSVVVPTYNRAGFLEKTIRSVLDQDFDDFELIVVDDGSTDDTSGIVASIKDSRITYYWKENEERAVARNVGTALSKGEYVTFLDSDDMLYKDHLLIADEAVENHKNPEWFHLGYEFLDARIDLKRTVDYMPAIANKKLIEGNHISCRGVFLRRDIAKAMPFNPERELSGTEDYELWLRLASRYPLYCDNRITSAIVQHEDRSVVTTDRRKLERRIEILESSVLGDQEFVRKFGSSVGKFKANNRVYIALHLALGGEREAAANYLFRSLKCSPSALTNRAFYGTLKRMFLK